MNHILTKCFFNYKRFAYVQVPKVKGKLLPVSDFVLDPDTQDRTCGRQESFEEPWAAVKTGSQWHGPSSKICLSLTLK